MYRYILYILGIWLLATYSESEALAYVISAYLIFKSYVYERKTAFISLINPWYLTTKKQGAKKKRRTVIGVTSEFSN